MGTAGWSVFSYLAADCFLVTPGERVRASLGCLTTGLCCVLGDPISSSVLTEDRKFSYFKIHYDQVDLTCGCWRGNPRNTRHGD